MSFTPNALVIIIPNIKPTIKKIRRRTFNINNKNIINENKANANSNSNYSNQKAEFIPPQYNFKYFRITDKGVVKRVQRSEIPFKINPIPKFNAIKGIN